MRAPQQQHEREKQNGNGHPAGGPSNGHIPAEIERGKQNGNGHPAGGPPGAEWEVLAAREPQGTGKGNGNGHGGAPELDEDTEPRLPKVRVSPVEDVPPAQREEERREVAGVRRLPGRTSARPVIHSSLTSSLLTSGRPGSSGRRRVNSHREAFLICGWPANGRRGVRPLHPLRERKRP